MKTNSSRTVSMFVAGCCVVAALWPSCQVRGALIAVRDYDENTVEANTVDKTAVSSNVTLADFKTDIAAAFDAGLGGVINFDNDPGWGPGDIRSSIDISFAGGTKTLTVARGQTVGFGVGAAGASATPISGGQWLGLSGNAGSVTFLFTVNGSPAPIVQWGITAVTRNADRNYTVTITHDDSTTYVFNQESVSFANGLGADDTFFGYKAPAGRTIASVNVAQNASPCFDDMAFVMVPEPMGITLAALGLIAVAWTRPKRCK